jgi:hypothetical protein
MNDMQQVLDEVVAEAPPEAPRKSSGYRRLQVRHRALIVENEGLKAELSERDEREAELQQSIGRLLEQHRRIMAEVRSPVRYGEPPPSWHEGANAILAQLETNPDRLALQTMVGSLAQLQSRLTAIVMRQPL